MYMSIRPLDMQVMVPKTQEIANIRHLAQQKSNINQQNIAQTVNNNIQNQLKNVVKPSQNEKAYTNSDAKKKGKKKYHSNHKQKENEKGKNKEKDNVKAPKRSRIDIRI